MRFTLRVPDVWYPATLADVTDATAYPFWWSGTQAAGAQALMVASYDTVKTGGPGWSILNRSTFVDSNPVRFITSQNAMRLISFGTVGSLMRVGFLTVGNLNLMPETEANTNLVWRWMSKVTPGGGASSWLALNSSRVVPPMLFEETISMSDGTLSASSFPSSLNNVTWS